MIASFVAYMQQTDEHQLLPQEVSRDPTHWMKAIFPGFLAVGQPLDMTEIRTRGRQDALELDAVTTLA